MLTGESAYCPKCRIDVIVRISDSDGLAHCPRCDRLLVQNKDLEPKSGTTSPFAINFQKRFKERPIVYGSEDGTESRRSEVRVHPKGKSTLGIPLHFLDRIAAEEKNLSKEELRKRKIQRFKAHVYPRLPKERFQYAAHWTFDLATAFNAVMALGVFATYILLILAIVFSLGYHVYSGIDALGDVSGNRFYMDLAIFLALFFLGVVIVIFLTKPFFVRPVRPTTHPIEPKSEPMIYKFAEALARYAGATPVQHIAVSQFSKLRFDFTHDQALVVGLPQLSTSTTREVACAMARAFGDRAQIEEYVSLRLVYWLVNWWRDRAERYDYFDMRIRRQFVNPNPYREDGALWRLMAKPVLFLLWFGVEACHKLFQFFNFVTRRICAGMLRQVSLGTQELVSHLVGIDGVTKYERGLCYLERSYEPTMRNFMISQDGKSPVRDFAIFLSINQRHMLGDVEEMVERDIESQVTSKLDLEDCGRVQIENATQLGERGVYTDATPATQLFFDLPTLSRKSTRDLITDLRFWDWTELVEYRVRVAEKITKASLRGHRKKRHRSG